MILTAVVLLAFFTAASYSNVTVNPSSSSCSQSCGSVVNGTSIDQALGNISSGDYLRLLPGCHCVRTFSVVKDVTNVSLIGDDGGGGIVQIMCAPGLGLAFLNVTRLSFQRLTITGCGLNGSNAVSLNTAINTIVDLFIQLAEDINIALVIASCTNVVMDHVTIVNTTGLGLVGVNVAGESSFTNNVFSFNRDRQCSQKVFKGLSTSYTVGGGASFSYVDYNLDSPWSPVNLTIDNSTFSYNSYCGNEIGLEIYSPLINRLKNRNYTVASGGGLTLSLAQHAYSVDVSVRRSTFANNVATIGSGAYVLWYAGSSDSSIVFSDCAFTRNYHPYRIGGGGGIGLFKDVAIPPSGTSRNGTSSGSQRSNTMTVLRTNFTENTASGIYVQSLYMYSTLAASLSDQLVLDSCHFEGNSGLSGAAVYVIEKKGHGTQEGLTVTVRNCTFVGNTMNPTRDDVPSGSDAVLQAVAVSVTIADSKFLSNVGTAVGGSSSLIVLEGEVVFYNNSALTGGALHLLAATVLLVNNNSRVAFYNNSATISGGAIYTDYTFGQSKFESYYDCFLYLGVPELFCTLDFPCPDITAFNISIVFMYNKAPLGSVLYGSTLDICSWAVQLKQSLNVSLAEPIFQVMYARSIIFHLDQKPYAPEVFSTPAGILDVDNTSAVSSYMPGQRFTLAIRSADKLNQTIQTVVTSQNFDNFLPMLGDSGYWLTSARNRSSAAVTKVYGQRNVTMNVTVYSVDTFIQSAPITVTLTECLFGFVYTDNGGGDCQCSKATTSSMVMCDEDLKLFYVTNGWWIGPDRPGGAGLIYKRCLFDYCVVQNNDSSVTVLPHAIDAQCANNRRGLLCGGCQEGYSAVFGTNRCMKCSDNTLGLLVFFAAAGVGIIAVISFLHITVSDGYINVLLFYVSIVSSYEVHITGRLPGREVFIPIYLLNLDMGFETCFYDGMTQLDRVGLNLVFPIYLFILMILFIWLASHSFAVSQWLAKNSFTPSKFLATLITLSYNSITHSTFQILGFESVTVYGLDYGKSSVIYPWTIDPNVGYFSPLHTVLFVVSVVLLIIFVIPVPFLLILPSFTSRLIWRLKPLYDAFVSPLKDKFAFWIGLHFVLRIIYFIISSFSEPPTNLLLLGVGLVLAIFLSTAVQPYKYPVHNILDSFFLCNILLLALGALYFQSFTNTSETSKGELGFVLVVVGVAYIVTCFVLGKLILVRFPWLVTKLRLRAFCKKYDTEPLTPKVNLDPPTVVQETDTQNHSPKLEKRPQAIPIFAQLREPLLDGSGFIELQ